MSDSSIRCHGFHPNLLRVVAELKPKTLRWPGGVFVQSYQWKDGIGPQHTRRVNRYDVWDDRDINCFGIDEFLSLCQMVRAEPVIVLNVGGRDEDESTLLQDALDLVQYCNGPNDSEWGQKRSQNGRDDSYGVKYWELGDTGDHWNMADYIDLIHQWSAALKRVDPTVQIIASGNYSSSERLNQVTLDLIDQCAAEIDFLSFEHYEDEGDTDSLLAELQLFLSSLRVPIQNSPNPNLKVAITEWGMRYLDWNAGLYAGGFQNLMETYSDVVAMASPAILLRHNSALACDYALINFDNTSWFAGPTYSAIKLWRDFYAPSKVALQGGQSLYPVATVSEDGRHVYLKLVNTSTAAQYIQVQVDTENAIQQSLLWSISASPYVRNTMQYPNTIKPTYKQINAEGHLVPFILPGSSVSVLDCRLAKSQPKSQP